MRVASYDIGSNSIILLVAERGAGGIWRPVHDAVVVARISEGLDQSGVLAEPAIQRAEAALRDFAAVAADLDVERTFVTGTAPFRRSSNGAEVAERLGRIIGAPVDIVSGEREAGLALRATQGAFPDLEELLVVDIGGASTEIVRATDAGVEMVSLDVGGVRLTERCVSAHPIAASELDALKAAVNQALTSPEVKPLLAQSGLPLVGVAGTVTTLVTAALEMDTYDANVVHGYELRLSEVERLIAELAAESVEERNQRPGIPAKRADVLPAGAVILASVMRAAGVDCVRVSDRGQRWGRIHVELDDVA